MAMKPRPYQVDAKRAAYAALRAHRSALVVMPTGTGKGFLIGDIIADAVDAGRRVLAFVHRREIIDQLADHARRATGLEPAIECAAQREATDDSLVVVGSVPSLVNRLDRFAPDRFDLLIADEAAHALAVTWRSLFDHFTGAKILGFTATPNRGDEKALGQVFDAVAYDMTLPDAIRDGWLVPIKTRSIRLESLDLSAVRKRGGKLVDGDLAAVMSEVAVLREAIVPAVKIAGARQSIVFTVTIAHMHCVAAAVREVADECGVDLPIATVDGTTPKAERREIMDGFRSRRIRWLINVGVATEGFDAPSAEVVIDLQPTLSRGLYMQKGGRVTRPLPGVVDGPETAADRRAAIADSAKTHCLWLDFARNSGRFDLASPMDLLGGDYDPVDQREADRLLVAGNTDDLLAALEQARAAREGAIADARARAGDPFALFGITSDKDRFGRGLTAKHSRVLGPLKLPRVLDYREANAVVSELARRDLAGLALYSQIALLARLRHPIAPLRTMTRAIAAELVRGLARNGWSADAGWPRLRELTGITANTPNPSPTGHT